MLQRDHKDAYADLIAMAKSTAPAKAKVKVEPPADESEQRSSPITVDNDTPGSTQEPATSSPLPIGNSEGRETMQIDSD